MYEVKRNQRFCDDLKLVDGDKELVISVDVDLSSAMHRYNRAKNDIIRIQAAKNSNPEEMGKAIVTLFSVFFGEDATAKIVEWYENRWDEMLEDLFPYIEGVVVPKLKEASAAKRDKLVAMYKASTGNRGARRGTK